ncbi:Peptide chain release factor subunit 1 [Candidatus Burarchaeum australiense]|nr:Peptide chain release factor subunit 1 [Candidatus Burarchaeum australiense]
MRASINHATGEARLTPESDEDIWHIERVLGPGDIVKSQSMRRFKPGEGESGDKRPVTVEIVAEKIEFHEQTGRLRITGKIKSGHPEEYIQIGAYHTIDVIPGEQVSVVKKWKPYQLERLKEAQSESRRPKLAIVAMDEEKATIALVKGYGVRKVCEIESRASKKDERKVHAQAVAKYYGAILDKVKGYGHRVIVAGPGFEKDNFRKFVEQNDKDVLARLSFEGCSNCEMSGIYELMRQGIVSKIAGQERAAREIEQMNEFIGAISGGPSSGTGGSGLAAYGRKAVAEALAYGAIERLMVNDELVRREEEIEKLVEKAEESGARVVYFNAHEYAGKQLEGFGGIAAFLKFKVK